MRFGGAIWFTLSFVSGCIPLAAQPSVSPVASSESRDVVPPFSSAGAITLPAASLLVDIVYPSGKTERGALNIVSDPQGGHHLWRYGVMDSLADRYGLLREFKAGGAGIYVDTDRLVEFVSSLNVEEHTGQSKGLDDAERASINEILTRLPSMSGYRGEVGFRPHLVAVPLFEILKGGVPMPGTRTMQLPTYKPIPYEFKCPPISQTCSGSITFVSIGKQGSNWRIVLRGRWDQEVILDSRFNPISTQQLTPAPSP
jgi:hypothetical protein